MRGMGGGPGWAQGAVEDEDRVDRAEAGRIVKRTWRMMRPYQRGLVACAHRPGRIHVDDRGRPAHRRLRDRPRAVPAPLRPPGDHLVRRRLPGRRHLHGPARAGPDRDGQPGRRVVPPGPAQAGVRPPPVALHVLLRPRADRAAGQPHDPGHRRAREPGPAGHRDLRDQRPPVPRACS